jgi:hypothetical protein
MKPKKQYGMDGYYTEKEKPMVYRNNAQKYDQYPNPSSNTLKITKGDSLDNIMRSKPMNEQQRLELIGQVKKTNPADNVLRIKSGSQLSKALNKFK